MKGRSTLSRMLSLRVQLLLSHLLLVILLGLVMSGGVSSFFGLSRSLDRVLQENLESVFAAQAMHDAVEKDQQTMGEILPDSPPQAAAQHAKNWKQFEEAFTAAKGATNSARQEANLEVLRQRAADYRAVVERYLASPDATSDLRSQFYSDRLEPALVGMDAIAAQFFQENRDAIVRESYTVKADVRRAATWSLGITLGALVLAVVLTLRMVRVVLTPLKELAERAERIGQGNLHERIQARRKDEIGALAQSFNSMAQNLLEARQKEERRLQRAEATSDAALASLYDPVVVSDAKGRIIHLNRAAEGLFGPAPASPRSPIVEHIGDKRIVSAIERAIQDDAVSASEDETALVPIKVGNTNRTYRLRATPMKDADGVLLGSVAVLEDVTHMRELDRLKTEFIGVASHELRTPVTSLLLSSELLMEGAAGPLTPEQIEIVKVQQQDLERLDKLMRELLDLTRLQAGNTPPRLELVPPEDLLKMTASGLKAAAKAKGVSLETQFEGDLGFVRADRSQLVRVLTNMANNAIRHTPGNGRVTLRASAIGDQVRFEVQDTGEGIPPEYLSRIFERFVQVPGATGGGAGLGLSISQTIVEAHGGRMKAESVLGEGSTFSFELPIERRPARGEDKV